MKINLIDDFITAFKGSTFSSPESVESWMRKELEITLEKQKAEFMEELKGLLQETNDEMSNGYYNCTMDNNNRIALLILKYK